MPRSYLGWILSVSLGLGGAFAQAPLITGGVVNGASGTAGIAAGSWITIFGTNLATSTRIWTAADFQNGRLPVSLDGVSVKVNNRDAGVYYISPTQINALAPADTALGAVSVTVTTPRGTSAQAPANYQTFAPALFVFDPRNRIYPAAIHPDGTLVGRADLFGTAAVARPAASGGRILLYGTGFGPTTPSVDPAVSFQGAAPLAAPNDLTILVGGVRAAIEFAGLTGNGLYQFNIVVPNVPDGDQTLVAEIGGLRTQSNLRLTVLNPPRPQIRYPGITEPAAANCPGMGCIGSVTVSPGEQVEFWVAGTNLAEVSDIRFSPPDGIAVSQIRTTNATVHALLTVSPAAATGERRFTVISPGGESNQSSGPLNISTFRISNLRVSDVSNTGTTLVFTVTLDYTDPTGAASSGELEIASSLAFGRTVIAGAGTTNPGGRTPGATSGVISLVRSYPGLVGTTGAIFTLGFTKDGRASDRLQVTF